MSTVVVNPSTKPNRSTKTSRSTETAPTLADGRVPTVRLSVNLASDVADALKSLSFGQGITITQGVRKAIVLWKLVADETRKGNRVMVVEGEGPDAKYREIVFV